jgi:C_GCAxxG_C_C family probable redox protein
MPGDRSASEERSVMKSHKGIHEITLPQSADWVGRVRENARYCMKRYEGCAQVILESFMRELQVEDPLVMASAGAMAAGMTTSLTCGIHVGGLMVLGLLMGRYKVEHGIDGIYPIVLPAQELMARLNKRIGSHSCKELTGVDFTDLEQAIRFAASEESEKCVSMVADGAEEIGLFLKELNERGELFRPHFT